uniref:Peptidase S1 domain-containing protein n=1 Tax=Strongyloides stercoralis TaxID=6248 RepID=A0A0K0DX26_STRER
MGILKKYFVIFLLIFAFNVLIIKSESNLNKPNNTYFFDLYNIYVLEHSSKDLWTCNDKVTILIDKEIYFTSAACSKSSNIITLTCDSHKDAYQFVSLPSNTIKTFNIKISVGNESFSGTFDANMTNVLSPQIVLINAVNDNENLIGNSTEGEKNLFNAYIVFMIAPTNTFFNKAQTQRQLSYINIILLIIVIVAILSSIIILWIIIWKFTRTNCCKKNDMNNKTKKRSTKVLYNDNNAWIDINELPSAKNLSISCDNFNNSKGDGRLQTRPQSNIIDNRPKLINQHNNTFKQDSINTVYPI